MQRKSVNLILLIIALQKITPFILNIKIEIIELHQIQMSYFLYGELGLGKTVCVPMLWSNLIQRNPK